MKKIFVIVLSSIVGAILLAGGVFFGAMMYNASIPHFDNYQISYILGGLDDLGTVREAHDRQVAEGYGVNYPNFSYINPYTTEIFECYAEVDGACHDYAFYVAYKYANKAKLDAEVEHTKTLLTIKFTGFGVLEDGTEENLDRTYIFDIDGVGRKKLPKLLNKAEIFEEF